MPKKTFIISTLITFLAMTSIAYAAWGVPVRRTANTLQDDVSEATCQGSNIHVLYEQYANMNSLNASTFYTRKTTTSWVSPIKLSTNTRLGDEDSRNTSIAVTPNNKAFVAYTIFDGLDEEIWFKTNATGPFSATPVKITNNISDDFDPELAYDPATGKLYIVYVGSGEDENYEIFIAESSNNGATWSIPKQLSSSATTDDYQPDIVIGANGHIYVSWITESWNTGAMTIRWGDYAFDSSSWLMQQVLARAGYELQEQQLVMNGTVPYLAYGFTITALNANGVGFSYYSGGWKTSNLSINSSASDVYDMHPRISQRNGRARVAWTRFPAGSFKGEIILRAQNSLGGAWSSPVNLTKTPGIDEIAGDICQNNATKSNLIYMVLVKSILNYNYEVYYRPEI